MNRITVAPDGRTFNRDGKPFFYLADTAWSAPTNATIEEWRAYLAIRASQGFTAIQINLLPQWDRSRPAEREPFGHAEAPFAAGSDGRFDYGAPNPAYFERVDALVQEVAAAGLVPALVLLWADYVPGNWCSRMNPGHEVPADRQAGLASYLAGRYARFDPVYLASGDTDLDSEETVSAYLRVLEASKAAAPDCLTCLHVRGDYSAIPEVVQASAHLDFYMYQSGHQSVQDHLVRLGREYRALRRRPIVNGEICYEGMGRFQARERFEDRDLRRAIWLSALAGAAAGFGYGAYGVWNWHRCGDESAWFDLFGPSPSFQQGLALPGADGMALIAEIRRRWGLHDLEPLEVEGAAPTVAWARVGSGGAWACYCDAPRLLQLPAEAGGAVRVTAWDFVAGCVRHPAVFRRGGAAWLDLGLCGGDTLLLLESLQ